MARTRGKLGILEEKFLLNFDFKESSSVGAIDS